MTKNTNIHTKIKVHLFAGVLVLMTAGCRGYFVKQWSDGPLLPDATLLKLGAQGYTNADQIVQYVDAGYVGTNPPAPLPGTADKDKITRRNEALNNLLRLSDERYDRFKTKAFFRDAGLNTAFDLTSLGLSAAASVVTSPVGPILSATDTGIKGAQKTVSDRWLQSQTMVVLLTSMDSQRAQAEATLLGKINTNSGSGAIYSNFTIEEGLRLAEDYQKQASLIEAMTHVQSTMSAEKGANEADATIEKQGATTTTGD